MVGLGRDPEPVPVVEEEVAAAGEVLVLGRVRRVGRGGQGVGGDRRQRVRVHDPRLRRGEQRRADAHEPALLIEGDRAAERRRACASEVGDRRVAERALALVGVGHPGVVVDVRVRARGHERVLRRDRRVLDLVLGRRGALVGRQRRHAGVDDRERRRARREGERRHRARTQHRDPASPQRHRLIPPARSLPDSRSRRMADLDSLPLGRGDPRAAPAPESDRAPPPGGAQKAQLPLTARASSRSSAGSRSGRATRTPPRPTGRRAPAPHRARARSRRRRRRTSPRSATSPTPCRS